MRPELPRGTVTFMFTDIEGSTRLLHELGPEAYSHELGAHRAALREAFAAHGGAEVDTQGDAFFAAFATATGAAEAARKAHDALAGGPVRVRIGLHTGVPALGDEGYVGVDVHRGARIAALAHGGQTLLSETTAILLEGFELQDCGTHRLKDFPGPTRIYQLGRGSFPPLRTPGSVELPEPRTSFLGREQQLFEAVSVLVDRDPPVLTIVGPGGTGKTRFAIELARLLADEADGGTLFVPCAPLRDPGLVTGAVAQALGAASLDSASIAAALHGRRTHVVLDNLEHLLPAAAPAIAGLLREALELRLLVTSREALRVQGEHVFDLPPLASDEAVELFLARARAQRSDIERTATVDELCGRLDCLPLALELAAARVGLLSPEALLARLRGRLDLLRGGRDSDPRHATLRATIAWSYDLLPPGEQRLFACLSVFAAGCTLESAELVCDADLSDLEALLDKSLLRRRIGALGEDRFWMLETIREFAAERLGETEGDAAVRGRHAERMLEIARSAHLEDVDASGLPQEQRHELVLAERDDVRAALDWAAEHDIELAVGLAVALENFWAAHTPGEGARRIGELLARADSLSPTLRAAALRVHGGASYLSGDPELGIQRYEESVALFRELGDERASASLLVRLALHAAYTGDSKRARMLAEQCLATARARKLPRLEAEALAALAGAARATGDLETAWDLTRRSAGAAAACGFRWFAAGCLFDLVELGLELSRLDDAERAGQQGLVLARSMEDRDQTMWFLAGLARLQREQGRLERAGRLWGAVTTELESEPLALDPEFTSFSQPLADKSDTAFARGVEQGRTLVLDEAIAMALGES